MNIFFTHMRRALPHLLALCFVIGMFAVADNALAQQTQPQSPSIAPTPSSSLFGVSDKLGAMFNNGIAWVAIGILSFFAWLTGLAGVLLNFSISYLVVGMGELVLDGGFGVTIGALWDIIRNLVNLAFIFSIVYLAIMTIVQGSTSKVKSALASIIVSMLLVNFSLYFAKAVIDVGNLTAFTIYHQMMGKAPVTYLNDPSYGIASVFADRLGATIFLSAGSSGGSRQQILQAAVKEGGTAFIILYALGGSILLFKLAVAFALGAFVLIIRFVMLILLMITSPVAFLPADLPMIGKYRDQWWKTLISQSFVAPVYLFGIYLSLLVLTNMPYQSKDGLAALFAGGGATNMKGALSTLLFYVISIVMIIGATMMAKSMSSSGAMITQALFKNAATRAVGSYVGRNTLGRAARGGGRLNDYLQGRQWGRNLKRGVSIASLGSFTERERRQLAQKGQASKFGGRYSLEDDEKLAKGIKQTQMSEERKDMAASFSRDPYNPTLRAAYAKTIRGMAVPEFEKQSLAELKKISGLLSNAQVDKIKDSKELSEEVKSDIEIAREADHLGAYGHDAAAFLDGMKPQDKARLTDKILLHENAEILKHLDGATMRLIQDGKRISPEKAQELDEKMRKAGAGDVHEAGLAYIDTPHWQRYLSGDAEDNARGGVPRPYAERATELKQRGHRI